MRAGADIMALAEWKRATSILALVLDWEGEV